MAETPDPLVFLHIGDLHLTKPEARNAEDFREILRQIDGVTPKTAFDFVYLPGDLAEDGCAAQYRILADALAAHPDLPVRLIPGDHDRQLGRMCDFRAFYAELAASRLATARPLPAPMTWKLDRPPYRCPQSDSDKDWPSAPIRHYSSRACIRGVLCLFLDIVSPGYGRKGIGLDFRLGARQTEWLRRILKIAVRQGTPVAVFMHAYPDDLREPDERLDIGGLFFEAGVRLVEMGHTHYNELAHDGHTLYAAARSVGQNEDGSVGYGVVALDGPVTSWRFKAFDRTWPFVLITSPADGRVATRPASKANTGMAGLKRGRIKVRAVVLSDVPPKYVHCRAGTGAWHTMTRVTDRVYEAWLPWPKEARQIQVEAVHPNWNGHGPDFVDTDVIEPVVAFDDPETGPLVPLKPGSDETRIRAWLQKGVRGDQLGPNRSGRKW